MYPATLLNSLISCSSFLVESFRFSLHSIMSSANNDSFTSSFPTWVHFTPSSCLIAVAKTFSTVLHRSGESRHTCLVPDLKENACSFCPLSRMLAVGLPYRETVFLLMFITLSLPLVQRWVSLLPLDLPTFCFTPVQ